MIKMLLMICCSFLLLACSQKPDAHDSKGNPISLTQYQGKWVIINYWATWCKPCLIEMPALDKLYQNNKNKLVVLGVSFDNLTNKEIENVVQKYKINYPMLSQFPIQKIGVTNVSVLPITFIINPKGKFVKTLKGPQTELQFASAIDVIAQGNPVLTNRVLNK